MEIVFGGRVGAGLQALGVGISRAEVIQTPQGPMILALSGVGGGLVCLGFDGAGAGYVTDTQTFSTDLWAAAGGLALISTTSGLFAAVAHQGANQLVGYGVAGGQIGALGGLTGNGIATSPKALYQEVGGFLFASGSDGVLRCFSPSGATSYQAGAITADTAASFHAQPGAVARLTVQGRDYLLTTCLQDTGVSVFEVAAGSGQLRHAGIMSAANGVGLFDKPIALQTASLGGRGYVLVASAAEQGTGAAISVAEVTAQGHVIVTDHILDSPQTRFGRVTGLSVVEHQGWVYVLAQGGEMGISLFTLLPGGQLLHLNTLVAAAGVDLTSQATLSALMVGDRLQIMVSSHALVGFSQFSVDLADQGQILQAGHAGGTLTGGAARDMLLGGAGNDTLSGGAGADILRDGAGQDRMTGGAGADVFMLVADGAYDIITDFDPLQDRIDLSLVPMLYSAAQISFSSRAWGAVLGYRGEELELRSASGQSLSQAQISAALLWATDRPPLILQQEQIGQAGDDTLLGHAGGDVLRGAGGQDELHGLEGDDALHGDDGDDRLYAGDGDDTVFGGNGNDLIFLGLGDDIAFGGDGFDTIHAGDGNDTVTGGNGRDLIYLNQGNDLFYDNAQGGDLGRDTVFAGYGDDTIEGGNGDDVFHGEWGNDLIFGRLGHDQIYGGDGFDTIYGGDGNDTVTGGNGRDLVFLNQGNDLFIDNSQGGDYGRDTVFAGYGNDTIEGGNGDDVFHGEWGDDVIFARLGNDTVYGGDQFDFIDAGDGNDLVFGGNGRDRIFLGNGDDTYVDTAQGGDLGQDTITGGAGADHFQFQAVMSADVITDFEIGLDRLHLTQSLWGGGLTPAQLVAQFASVTAQGVLLDFGGGRQILLEGLGSAAGLEGDISWL